jgi:hypothetical protein
VALQSIRPLLSIASMMAPQVPRGALSGNSAMLMIDPDSIEGHLA